MRNADQLARRNVLLSATRLGSGPNGVWVMTSPRYDLAEEGECRIDDPASEQARRFGDDYHLIYDQTSTRPAAGKAYSHWCPGRFFAAFRSWMRVKSAAALDRAG